MLYLIRNQTVIFIFCKKFHFVYEKSKLMEAYYKTATLEILVDGNLYLVWNTRVK